MKFSLGPDQAIRLHREQNGSQRINHLVSAVGLVGNFGIEPDEGQSQPRFHHHVAGLTGNVIGRHIFPMRRRTRHLVAERIAPARRIFQNQRTATPVAVG